MSGLPHLAQLDDIHAFGRRTAARSMLPVLVRRIIAQLNDSVTVLRMAGEEDTDLPGYDGVVSAGRGDAFVPEGRSVWEFGTSSRPADKAEEDYEKRTKDPLGEDPSTTTFVFVTPHRWADSETWAMAKREGRIWKDVRVHTGNDILTAMEETPAPHIWFSELLGKPATGAASLESWWTKYQSKTKGLLTPGLVLMGRADDQERLLHVLTDQESGHLWVRAATPEDVLAFVAAALAGDGEGRRDDLLARALVVYEPGVLRYLDHSTNLLILVPFNESLVREADLVTNHHVILTTTDVNMATIDLPPIPISAATEVLRGQSVPEDEAREYARAAFRSIPLFRSKVQGLKLLAGQLGDESVATSRIVRRAWFLSRWNTRRSGEQQVIATLTGSSEDDIAAALEKYASGADPIFSRVGDTWGVIAPEASSGRIVPVLTSADLSAFETVVQDVLGSVDPALALPAKDRWLAALHGKSRQHSSDLRSGIATSLALFSTLTQPIANQAALTPRGWAAQIVRAVLMRANEDESGDLWLSVVDLLPKLAEAAPDEVLAALRTALGTSGSMRPRLFAESTDFFASTSPHVHVLWALERLAWSPEHFGAAVQLLARLASFDPGGNRGNRPLGALTRVLFSWRPQTAAPRDDRNKAVESIARRFPSIGGQLCVALIPDPGETFVLSPGPEFRDWKSERPPTLADIVADVTFYAKLSISLAADDPDIWLRLVPKLPHLPPEVRGLVLDALAASAIEPVEMRTKVWAALTDLIRRHDEYAEQEWALPPDQVDRLRGAAASLTPDDVAVSVGWLFDHLPTIGVPATNFERYTEALEEAQDRAVHDVLAAGGPEDIHRLAKVVKSPEALGYAFVRVDSGSDIDVIAGLVADENAGVRRFAMAAIAKATNQETDRLVSLARALEAPDTAKARVLLVANDLEPVWAALPDFGPAVEDAYWAEFSGFGRGADFELVNEAARGLADHGRVAAALDLLAIYSYRSRNRADPQLVAELLRRLLSVPDSQMGVLSQYDLEQLFELLRAAPAVDEDTVATLEWSFLPALEPNQDSLTLQRRLADNPQFFVDVMSIVFRSKAGDDEVPPSSANTAALATNGFRLLHNWRVVPGTDTKTGEVDPQRLTAWVTEARQLLAGEGRADIGDSQIGQVLAYAPSGKDGVWPCEPVRDLLEELAAEHINSGLEVGLYNKRGVVSRGLDQGGEQEYELERQYIDWAQALAIEWPVVAGLLRDVAKTYHSEGVRNDEEAQRFREGFDR